MRTFVRCRRKLNNNILNVSIIVRANEQKNGQRHAQERDGGRERERERGRESEKEIILKNTQKKRQRSNGCDIFIRLVRFVPSRPDIARSIGTWHEHIFEKINLVSRLRVHVVNV